MPVNALDPNDPLSPLFPQYPQSYPVLPLPSSGTNYPFFSSILPLENPSYAITPGYNKPTKKPPVPGLDVVFDFREDLVPPRVTPRVPAAKVPPSPIGAVTAPALYNNVNFQNQPKLKFTQSLPVSTITDPNQWLR